MSDDKEDNFEKTSVKDFLGQSEEEAEESELLKEMIKVWRNASSTERQEILEADDKFKAIKRARSNFELSLKEAKTLVEWFWLEEKEGENE